MKRVILKTESYYTKNRLEIDFVSQGNNSPTGNIATTDAQTSVSMAAITLAEQVGAKLILAETLTGSTALSIASIRPPIPVIIASPNKKVCNQMAIVWGGKPYLVSKKQNVSAGIIKKLLVKKNLSSGDWVVQVFGTHSSVVGGTDTVRLLEV